LCVTVSILVNFLWTISPRIKTHLWWNEHFGI